MSASITNASSATVGTAADCVGAVSAPQLVFTITGGTPSSFQVLLEGSLDNSTWVSLGSATVAAPADGARTTAGGTLVASGAFDVRYIRANLTSLVQPAAPFPQASFSASVYPF